MSIMPCPMFPVGVLTLAGAVLLSAPAAGASGPCLLCAPSPEPSTERPPAPLSVEVDASLDFPRAAVGRGGGRMVLDPRGPVRVSGNLTALGGLSMHGRVLVRGEPGRLVRISMPERVILHTPAGAEAELSRLEADLPASARIGPDGTLRFHFGGELAVRADGEGDYRGRIPITVDYL